MELDVNTDQSFLNFLPGRKEDDSGLIVRFHLQPRLLVAKSNAAGRKIYADAEYCEIRIKGQPKQVVDELVTPDHIAKFPVAYAYFKAQKEMPLVGTPIEQLPGITPSVVERLKVMRLRSCEDVASASDAAGQEYGPGFVPIRNQCKAFVGQTSEQTVALQDENKLLKEQMAAQQKQMAQLLARTAALENSKTQKRARKLQEAVP
jgi:hypothetical protein